MFLGSLVLGWISHHIGRQKIFTFSFLLITLASFLQFFATTPEHLIGLRILIGIGLGGDYSVGHTLLVLTLPCRHRGILLGAFSVVWTVGYVWQVLPDITLFPKTRRPGAGYSHRQLCPRC